MLTGTSVKSSTEIQRIANTWNEKYDEGEVYTTVGIHPHDAKTFEGDATILALKKIIEGSKYVRAIGECGLDYNRNFSPKDQQITAFRAQVRLACDLKMPIFVHEREAHGDLVNILKEFKDCLPDVVVHCFTGKLEEAQTYIDMGFHVGFTGTLCKFQRGKPLREIIPKLPLNRLMLETDAPWMGFIKGRRVSEPADVVLIAKKIASVLGCEPSHVARVTTATARKFFRI
jgi:TatD DNase family protein